jgi:hypothetical protein
MADFNARHEAELLHNMLRTDEYLTFQQGGNLVALKLLTDTQAEFCKLDNQQKTSTIAELYKMNDLTVQIDGFGTPTGVMLTSTTSSAELQGNNFLSFVCSNKN